MALACAYSEFHQITSQFGVTHTHTRKKAHIKYIYSKYIVQYSHAQLYYFVWYVVDTYLVKYCVSNLFATLVICPFILILFPYPISLPYCWILRAPHSHSVIRAKYTKNISFVFAFVTTNISVYVYCISSVLYMVYSAFQRNCCIFQIIVQNKYLCRQAQIDPEAAQGYYCND